VTESDLEMFDMVIQFGNGGRWSPGLRHFFREGSRSRAIDLPGHVRFIRDVELVYGNMPGGGRAHVELWGQWPRVTTRRGRRMTEARSGSRPDRWWS
jgi:hypothetical protein